MTITKDNIRECLRFLTSHLNSLPNTSAAFKVSQRGVPHIVLWVNGHDLSVTYFLKGGYFKIFDRSGYIPKRDKYFRTGKETYKYITTLI